MAQVKKGPWVALMPAKVSGRALAEPPPFVPEHSSSSAQRKRQQSWGRGRFSPGAVNTGSSGAEPCARRMRFRGTAGFIHHNTPYTVSREMARYTQH